MTDAGARELGKVKDNTHTVEPMKHRRSPDEWVLQRLVEIANQNSAYNYGRTFSVDSLRVFLGNCLTYRIFEKQGHILGVVSVRQDGELGFIVDPARVRDSFRVMTGFARGLELPLWAKVQTDNQSVCALTRRLGFQIVSKTRADTVLRRDI